MTVGDTMRDGRRGGTTFPLAISVLAITLVMRVDSVRAAEDPAALTYLPARNEFVHRDGAIVNEGAFQKL